MLLGNSDLSITSILGLKVDMDEHSVPSNRRKKKKDTQFVPTYSYSCLMIWTFSVF